MTQPLKESPVSIHIHRPSPPSDRMDHPNRFFDRIFIINLQRCPDRWNKVTRNLLDHGIINFERQPGISLPRRDPSDSVPLPFYSNLEAYGGHFKFDPNYILNCVGTNLAHQEIIRKAHTRGYTRILILEDDVFFGPDSIPRFCRAVSTLRQEPWQLLYLGYKRSRSSFPSVPVSKELSRPKQFIRGAYGYAVHSSLFPALLQMPPYGGMELDVFFEFVICKRGRALCFNKPVISHRDALESTITQAHWKSRKF
jgi:hypothetical protein